MRLSHVFGLWLLEEERSALHTFPQLRNFRVAVLRDFRRVFAHVAPVFLERGIANIETKVGHRIPVYDVFECTFVLNVDTASPTICA